MWPVAIAVLGLFIGSFLNVCIHRIPRSESIMWPASHCPVCNNPIKPWDNIPLVSYILLGGRCRSCSAKISLRYPVVETLSALLALSMLYRFGLTVSFGIYYLWACVLLVITFIDIDYQIIPDRLSLGGIILGLGLVYWLPLTYKDAIIGLVLGSGLLIAVIYGYYFLTKKQGMGGGDVKLLGMIGVFTGWQGVLFTIFMGSLIGTLFGLPWALMQKKTMKAAIPFGPFLALGALIFVLWGTQLTDWYFGFLR
ncbi:MAG TPA: prepilin peptidase [Deltaproteobacteria bacterium]|nr:prepilin peptidase [Deltaproteobacteria bacterium]HPJ93616.1 prepilin peptidase [Deltaproteobacteria bacterium]